MLKMNNASFWSHPTMQPHRPFFRLAAGLLLMAVPSLSIAAPGEGAVPARPGPAPEMAVTTLPGVAQEWEFHRRSTSPKYRPVYRSTFDTHFSYPGYCPSRPYFLSRCATCGNYSAISASRR